MEEGDGRSEAQDGAEEDAEGAEHREACARAEERETAPLHALQDSLEHTPRLFGPAAAHMRLSLVHSCAQLQKKSGKRKKKEKKEKQSVKNRKKEKENNTGVQG